MIIVSIEQNKVVTTWEVVTADDYGIQCGQSIDRLSSNRAAHALLSTEPVSLLPGRF